MRPNPTDAINDVHAGSERAILVLGCGAIGGLYAAHLAAVARVVALDSDQTRVAAINRDGLQVIGKTKARIAIDAVDDPRALAGRAFDAVVVAVKSMHTETAFAALAPHLSGRPLVLSLQNGQGNVEVLARLGDFDLWQGLTWEAGEMVSPTCVRHLVHGPTAHIGPMRGRLADGAWLAAVFSRAGLPTECVDDPRGAIWTKFLFNCAMNPISALLHGVPEAKYANEDTYALLKATVAEGKQVAAREGITLDGDPLRLIEDVRAGRAPMPRHMGSMAQDLARGTPSEIEALTGYLIAKARQHGVPAPHHETLYRLVKGLEFGLAVQRQGSPP